MRSLLRRLLWLGPIVVLITMVTFGALSLALEGRGGPGGLPLFFNPEPGAIERLATSALASIATPKPPDLDAQTALARLGGAALPFVLPALDSLSPDGRARVVAALRPVGARMGLELDPGWEPSREVVFWTRFWEEHSIDYRPVVARRAVLRLIQKSTLLRDAEVRQLDTYALDEIMRQMAPVDDTADVDRLRRLTDIALDMLGDPGPSGVHRLPLGAGVDEARRVAASWADWWSAQRTRYRTYRGTERLAAMLRDTRYGGWVARAARHDLGRLEDGRSVGEVLRQGLLVSGSLVLGGLAGALGWSLLGAFVAGRLGQRRLRWVPAVFLLRAALPVAVVTVLLTLWLGDRAREAWIGALLMGLCGAPLAPLRRARPSALGADFLRTLESFGAPRWQRALVGLRLSSPAILVQLGAQLSSLISLAFVVEHVLGLQGLGAQTVQALREPDLNWLMAITITLALLVGLLAAASEVLLALLDPRWQGSVERLGGAG